MSRHLFRADSLRTWAILLMMGGLTVASGCKKKAANPQAVPATKPGATAKNGRELQIRPGQTMPTPPNGSALVVSVDGRILDHSELQRRLQANMPPSERGNVQPQMIDQMRAQWEPGIIQSFINETLLDQESTKRKLEVLDEDVTKALEEARSRLPQGVTMEQFLQSQGLSEANLKENADFMTGLKRQKLINELVKDVPEPSAEEVRAWYDGNQAAMQVPEMVHARHILFKVDEGADAKVKAQKKADAEKCREEIVGGADFAATATQRSDCPSKNNGGDLGFFPRDKTEKAFEAAAFSQKVDEIGPVVETVFGFHIIQVVEHRQAGTKPFEEVKDQIAGRLRGEKVRPIVKEVLQSLKALAKIEYGEGYAPPPQPPAIAVTPVATPAASAGTGAG